MGARIRYARELVGLSQAALADAIGVRPTSVWRFEHDENAPSAESAVLLARALGVTVEWIVMGDGAGPKASTGTDG